ncbi:MAG: U32 family peptidase [Lachnospiraceae bacterium]|nr:U32 family peptidase [Candidatus Colinaster scatohippi]
MAAINAGADAVYMAGKSFGARASANNFTEEEFIDALNIAHIHGRKIYLTLNTLIKEREWGNIYSFLKPLYEAGLDGVIIQDLGLIDYLSRQFPELPLHASTQMTITDFRSAKLLKEKGICRVVPARELSLDEIITLKQETGLEIETFIHGALCYGYSGQCLFSSYLGGRSGNRGRCAGPCRLPYEVLSTDKKTKSGKEYPLSLKDLCTIRHIKELIEAGIDSFKIEGRMKSAEYVAGVTAIYRKYVDAYYANECTDVSIEDITLLESLYLRSSIGSGYYYKHNGAEMISIKDPSYNNQDQNTVNYVAENIMCKEVYRYICGNAYLHAGEPMSLTIWDSEGNSAYVEGAIVDEAMSRSALVEDVRKQLCKTGGTAYKFEELNIDLGNNCFVPVKAINELRRAAILEYEKVLLADYIRITPDIIDEPNTAFSTEEERRTHIGVSILSEATLKTILLYDVERLYIPYDLFFQNKIDVNVLLNYKRNHSEAKLIISLPRIIRKRDGNYLESLSTFLKKQLVNLTDSQGLVDGILVRNLEEINYIAELGYNKYIELDYTLYCWNRKSLEFLRKFSDRLTAPLELSSYELAELGDDNITVVMYGYAPLMVSANCLAKTYGNCTGKRNGFDYRLIDRYGKSEKVYINCCHCYNEIFNAIPTSLHKKYDELIKKGFRNFRLDFTIESADECKRVMDYYFNGDSVNSPVDEFTSGHIDKGAI